MTMLFEPLVVLCAFALYLFTVLRSTGFLTANALFVYLQLVMAVGTYGLLEPSLEADLVHGRVILVSFLLYLAVSAAALLHRPTSLRTQGRWVPPPPSFQLYTPGTGVGILILFSIGLTLLYFQSIGYSALVEGLRNAIAGGDADVAGLRLDSYAGERYLAPGYVNQFKNILLPSLVLVVAVYWHYTRKKHGLVLTGLVVLAIFALTGTGQRTAFLAFAFVAAFVLYLLNGRRLSWLVIKLGLASMTVVIISTIALGRQSVGGDGSLGDHIGAALEGFLDRIFQSQQVASVAAFRYIYERPIRWGGEWAESFAGLLPGVSGSTLANEIFDTLYGSTRGTSPPSIWGSAFHNFGWFGVIAMAAALALLLAAITRAATAPITRNTLELVGVAGASVVLGMWIAGGPTVPFNTGLVMYGLLWWAGRNARLRVENRDSKRGHGAQSPFDRAISRRLDP